jgi:uncharacterized protein YjiS (DUF1127 family)
MLQDQLFGKALGSYPSTRAVNSQGTAPTARNVLLMLIQHLWAVIVACKRRQELARLDELDDRMLADIGITRNDLSAVGRAPLLRDPTKLLAQRVRDRQDARHAQPDGCGDDVPHPPATKGEFSHVTVRALNFVGY